VAQLLALVLLVYNVVTRIATIVGVIQGLVTKAARENVPFAIDTSVSIIRSVVDWSNVTPGPLKIALTAIEADSITHTTAILDAIALLQLAADPVILPTTPPTGYGGGTGSFSVADIWNYQYPPASGNIVGDKLVKAGRFGEFVGQDAWFPSAYAKYVGHHFDYSNLDTDPSTSPVPNIDPSTILVTDATILDWLNRTVSGFTWEFLGTQVVSFDHIVISDEWWVCTISQLEFDQYKSTGSVITTLAPPVWPGIANVTFGDEVPLTNGLDLSAYMDGVILVLSEVDPKKAFFTFAGYTSWRNVGAIAFYNDDSRIEAAQTIGLDYGIYTPKTMKQARGVVCRTTGIISATIQPWVITI
jgi:hypothetical protein